MIEASRACRWYMWYILSKYTQKSSSPRKKSWSWYLTPNIFISSFDIRRYHLCKLNICVPRLISCSLVTKGFPARMEHVGDATFARRRRYSAARHEAEQCGEAISEAEGNWSEGPEAKGRKTQASPIEGRRRTERLGEEVCCKAVPRPAKISTGPAKALATKRHGAKRVHC